MELDRVRGVLVGLALGDALGAPVEFDSPARIGDHREELFELPGGGGFDWEPGEFTDDTQMALVLARHLDTLGGAIDQDELVLDFVAWMDGAKDVGVQTSKVLQAVAARGETWQEATARLPVNAEGNGCIMRAAPVALCARSREEAADLARQQAMVTHPRPLCIEASAAFGWILRETLETGKLDLSSALQSFRFPLLRDYLERSKLSGRPRMSGWVVDTLLAALWAVQHAERFDDAIWNAVSLGNDADTVGAVAGALAGAQWGLRGIPQDLAARLTSAHPSFAGEYPDDLIEMAELLARHAREE